MIVYDMEVFKYDWFLSGKDVLTREYVKLHNDIEGLKELYEQRKDDIWVGHNINHYDNLILKCLLRGVECPELKKISDDIIINNNGKLIERKYKLKNIKLFPLDMMTDAIRYSLKEVEGFLGLSIEETSVSFDIDRPLTNEEIEDVFHYNIHDVDATVEELTLRAERLINKIYLLKEYNLPKSEIEDTNAQLCAKILHADYKKFEDGLDPYDISVAPIDIKKYTGCVDFFTKCEKLEYKRQLEIEVAGVPHILANGGLHGAIDNYMYDGEMWLVDVASYYPNMMVLFNLCSRAMKDPAIFKNLIDTRIEAKNLKGKYKGLLKTEKTKENQEAYKKYSIRAEALKLPINTVSGAMKAKTSKLYDERNNNWMCITGQLLLIDLIEHLEPYCKLVQSNTDGIIIIPLNRNACDREIKNWEDKTGLVLEKTIATKIFQKDVNNYILLDDNSVKTKGAFVAQYHNENRYADMLRRNLEILDDAVVDFLIYDVPIEDTICKNNPLVKYQLIKKLGNMYEDIVLYRYNGEELYYDRNVNKVNRIFATKDASYGKLMKKKASKEKYDSVEGCPEHCFIYNKDVRSMTTGDIDIDYDWYISQAKDRVFKFLFTDDEQKDMRKYTPEEKWNAILERLGR